MKTLFTLFIYVVFISPCVAQNDLLPAYPREINYQKGVAYFNGSPFTGILISEKTNKKIGEYKNGNRSGVFTDYYLNGKKKYEYKFLNGIIMDGRYITYLDNGEKETETTYENGKLISYGIYVKGKFILKDPYSAIDINKLEQIESLEETVAHNPNDSQTLLQIGHLLNDAGLKERAIEKYILYLKFFPQNADVWIDIGVCYFDIGKNDDAISSMGKALKIDPQHQIANFNLGIINMTIGNTEKAIGYWKKVMAIDSTNEIGQRAKELIISKM